MSTRRGIGLFRELNDDMAEEFVKTKGRDAELIAQRDKRMYHRYYYYTKLQKLLFEQVIEHLSREFDLSPETIPRVIEGYRIEVRRLMNDNVTVEQLRKMYWWMVWEKKS